MVGMQSSPSGMEGFARRLDWLQRQIDEIRGAAGIKSAVLRAASILFQSGDGDHYATLGEFAGKWWERVGNDWIPDTIRGLSIGRAGDTDPSFSFGHAINDNKMTATMGEGNYGPLDSLVMSASEARLRTESTEAVSLVLASTGAFLNGVDVVVAATDDFDVDAASQVRMDSGGGMFLASGSVLDIDADGDITITSANGLVRLNPVGGDLEFFNIGSHATPANLSISSSVVKIVSSAAKYKDDIAPIVVNVDELLSVSGVTYVDKGEKATRDNPPRYPGFIADEWAEHESLRQFVIFGPDGQVESFYYDRLPAALLEVDKQQQAEIDDLRAENTELKARLDAIEARLVGQPETPPGKK